MLANVFAFMFQTLYPLMGGQADFQLGNSKVLCVLSRLFADVLQQMTQQMERALVYPLFLSGNAVLTSLLPSCFREVFGRFVYNFLTGPTQGQ